MEHLEQKLSEHADKRVKMVVTDGNFSMDGDLAPLDRICELAEKYGALVFVDDSHATGFIGRRAAVRTSTAASSARST
jgi:glycine C-acetyltransferase